MTPTKTGVGPTPVGPKNMTVDGTRCQTGRPHPKVGGTGSKSDPEGRIKGREGSETIVLIA